MDQRSVVRTYYLLAGLYTLSASLIWGVNTLFLLDAGLSIGQVFVANAVFSAGMVVFEIPTGVVADTLGRRVSFLVSLVVLAATTILYLVMAMSGQGVLAFSVVSLFIGLGFTFYSGALEAWLVDALDATGGADLDRVFARAQQVTGAAMLLGTIGGGLLGQLDLAIPFVVRAGLLVLLFVLALPLMQELGFTPRELTVRSVPRELVQQAQIGLTHGWSRPGLRPLMLTSAVRSGLLFWAFYAAQPYLLVLLERDAVWVVGVVTAGLAVATMIGNQVVDSFARFCHRRTTLLAWAVLVTAGSSVLMGVTGQFAVAVAGFLLMGAALGVIDPVHRAYLHSVTTSQYRATVVSFDSMIGSTGGFGGQLGLGALSDLRSIGTGYTTGGVATLVALPLLWAVRRVGGPADQVVGLVSAEGSCFAAGLPEISQVNAEPSHDLVA